MVSKCIKKSLPTLKISRMDSVSIQTLGVKSQEHLSLEEVVILHGKSDMVSLIDQWVKEQMKLPWWREFPKSEFDCHSLSARCWVMNHNGVLVSYSCYNKLLHTWRLKITEMYSGTDLEPLGVWSQSVSGPTIPPVALGGNLSLPLLVPGGSRLLGLLASALQCLHLSSYSLLLCVSSLLSLIKTQHWL